MFSYAGLFILFLAEQGIGYDRLRAVLRAEDRLFAVEIAFTLLVILKA